MGSLILTFGVGRGGTESIHKRKASEGERGAAEVQVHGHPGATPVMASPRPECNLGTQMPFHDT